MRTVLHNSEILQQESKSNYQSAKMDFSTSCYPSVRAQLTGAKSYKACINNRGGEANSRNFFTIFGRFGWAHENMSVIFESNSDWNKEDDANHRKNRATAGYARAKECAGNHQAELVKLLVDILCSHVVEVRCNWFVDYCWFWRGDWVVVHGRS